MDNITTPTKTIEYLVADAQGEHIAYCYGSRTDRSAQNVAKSISHAVNCHDDLVAALEAVVSSGLLSGSYELHENVRGFVMDALLKANQI